MHIKRLSAAGPLLRVMLAGLICLGFAAGLAGRAAAQEVEPYEFTPLPAGTNLALGYYVYGHNTDFNISGGPTIKHSGVEINVGVARYVHFFNNIAGHPFGIQIYETFGSLSGAHVDGQRLGSAFGAQNTTLSAFIFPYVNTASKTNVAVTAFLNPPDGTYDRHSAINVGDNRLRGTVQIGVTQGFGEHLGLDAAFDAQFYGDNNDYIPGNRVLSQNPTYRGQLWANWRWSRAFTTSVGWEGLFGGRQQVNGTFDRSKTEEQRVRVNAALFVTPRIQTMLELNHDLYFGGGFKQEFGATLRVAYVF